MMKRLLLTLCLLAGIIWTPFILAENIGVVNMRQIFQSSPQIKKINAQLNKQFSPQRNKIVSMGKSLQGDVKKLQRNQSVMDKKSLAKLKNSIADQEQHLRTTQAKFQKTLFTAQNKAMSGFMTKITGVVKAIALKKNLDIVLPKNTVLYAKGSMDITSDVVSALQK